MEEAKYVMFTKDLDWWLGEVEFDDEMYDPNDDDDALNKFRNDWPSIVNDKDELQIIINIKTGFIENWPEGKTAYFGNVKLVDTASYALLDRNKNIIKSLRGYVPTFFSIGCNGWGDYMTFEVEADGHIKDWSFGEKEFQEIEEKWK